MLASSLQSQYYRQKGLEEGQLKSHGNSKLTDEGLSLVCQISRHSTCYVPLSQEKPKRGKLLDVFNYWNESGRADEATFRKIAEDFRDVWARDHPGLQCLLLGDTLGMKIGIDFFC